MGELTVDELNKLHSWMLFEEIEEIIRSDFPFDEKEKMLNCLFASYHLNPAALYATRREYRSFL